MSDRILQEGDFAADYADYTDLNPRNQGGLRRHLQGGFAAITPGFKSA